MEGKEELFSALNEGLQKVFEEAQKKPDQYVVVYKRVSDDEVIGYHKSTFCTHTPNILEGKRYNGDNPYPQLEIIAGNLKSTLECPLEPKFDSWKGVTQEIHQNFFGEYGVEDVYLDAVYLEEGTPTQSFKMSIINLNKDE